MRSGSADPASAAATWTVSSQEFGSELRPSSKLDRLSEPDRRVRELARPRSRCTSNTTIQWKNFLGVINQTSETSLGIEEVGVREAKH